MVVSNLFYFHPYLWEIPILTHIFGLLKPPTSKSTIGLMVHVELGKYSMEHMGMFGDGKIRKPGRKIGGQFFPREGIR